MLWSSGLIEISLIRLVVLAERASMAGIVPLKYDSDVSFV
jgi:hypothetical protein